jgi:hypothetical protein
MSGFGTGAGKGSLPRHVDQKKWQENRSKIDFSGFRKELEEKRKAKEKDGK